MELEGLAFVQEAVIETQSVLLVELDQSDGQEVVTS